jgi:hypothetical protein
VLICGEPLHAIYVTVAAGAVVVVVVAAGAVVAAAAAAFNKACCHKNSNPERNIAASMK